MATGGQLTVRDAQDADVPGLTLLKGDGSEALHHDRLREAQGGGFRYIVLTIEHTVIAAACLVFRRPSSWSDAEDATHLPQLVDLQVLEVYRGRGYGTALVRALERITAAAGQRALYLRVDPVHNPRAYRLYQRLGYRQEQAVPYRLAWAFTDSGGLVHRGEEWAVDMVKQVNG
jgi:GNAT superfamily N-acetyltransferase